MKMPALVRAKNTVTVSIIINFLVRAPHANVTTGHAAQSKGFRSGKRQSDPTDDFGQQRRAPGQKPPLKGHADRCPGTGVEGLGRAPAGAVSERWITAFSRSAFKLPTRRGA